MPGLPGWANKQYHEAGEEYDEEEEEEDVHHCTDLQVKRRGSFFRSTVYECKECGKEETPTPAPEYDLDGEDREW